MVICGVPGLSTPGAVTPRCMICLRAPFLHRHTQGPQGLPRGRYVELEVWRSALAEQLVVRQGLKGR